MSDVKTLNGYSIKDEYARQQIAQMKADFQDGVDTLYNACVSAGVTPASSTPTDIAQAISQIYSKGKTDKANEQYTISFSCGGYMPYPACIPLQRVVKFKVTNTDGVTWWTMDNNNNGVQSAHTFTFGAPYRITGGANSGDITPTAKYLWLGSTGSAGGSKQTITLTLTNHDLR